jgi:hypothetical protein
MTSRVVIFQMRDVAKLLKANRFTLNRLMLRCDIETSVGSRAGRGSRILFAIEDVCRLALAYWLFRSGLRTPAIKNALANKNLISVLGELTDIDAARNSASLNEFLVTWRTVKAKKVVQEVRLEADVVGIAEILIQEHQFGFVVIPFQRLLTELTNEIWESCIAE